MRRLASGYRLASVPYRENFDLAADIFYIYNHLIFQDHHAVLNEDAPYSLKDRDSCQCYPRIRSYPIIQAAIMGTGLFK